MNARAGVPADAGVRAPRSGREVPRVRPWWPRVKRVIAFAYFALVAALLFVEARTVDWHAVFASIRLTPGITLAAAAMLAAASHLLYTCYDLLGRRYTNHALPARTVMAATFVSYVFNLNLGTLVGGIGVRYRLYSQLGLKAGVITRVVAFSILTNWLGYALLAGAMLWWSPLVLPAGWSAQARMLQALGVLLSAAALGYVGWCAFARRRVVHLRRHELALPTFTLALLQLLVSCGNWLLIAGTIYVLLARQVEFAAVLFVLLAAAVAGVISHIPAGLGVLEAVFVALLSQQIPREPLLAALLTYRALYYLAPLVIAASVFALLEARVKRNARLE